MRTHLGLGLLLFALSTSACGGGGGDTPTTPPSGPTDPALLGGFTTETIEFASLMDAARGRAVPSTVITPQRGGPFPLLVVSHGAGGTRDTHEGQALHIASHGFVVVLVEHVGSNLAAVNALAQDPAINFFQAIAMVADDTVEYVDRPADVSFVIDEASSWNATHASLMGKIDARDVGVMGHSFGAYTALVSGGALAGLPGGLTSLVDTRVAAIVAMSPQGTGSTGNFDVSSFAAVSVPALLLTGSEDDGRDGLPASWRQESYDGMPPGNKVFASLENTGHLHFAGSGATDIGSDTQRMVRALAVAFFQRHVAQVEPAVSISETYADSLTGAGVPDVVWLAK